MMESSLNQLHPRGCPLRTDFAADSGWKKTEANFRFKLLIMLMNFIFKSNLTRKLKLLTKMKSKRLLKQPLHNQKARS